MAKPSNRKRGRKAPNILLEKGLVAIAGGAGLLLLSSLLGGGPPMVAAVAQALGMPAWWAMGIGLVLVLAHLGARLTNKPAIETPITRASPPRPPNAIRALIDQAERDFLRAEAEGPLKPRPAIASPAPGPAPAMGKWGPDVFAAIEWRRFEAVCETLFAQAGFETRAQSHGADGGVDIWLHSKNAQGPAAVVQCKHWQGKSVGVQEMRSFFGVMASHGLKRGTYATTSTYTAEARSFASANGINALNGAGLLALIHQRTPAQQAALLATAFEGEYWKPTCASCGVKMVERLSSRNGDVFWGCGNFPRCRRTLNKRSLASAG
jgi:restriction system protein